MQELKSIKKTKRQENAENIRARLCEAMDAIMEKYDYSTVTIRNICTVSGVAYGSFYNLFESKEGFLQYYLSNDFVKFMDEYYKQNKDFEGLNSLEKSIDIFACCAEYNMQKGVKFISGFYSPQNHTLFPQRSQSKREYSFTPLIRLGSKYLNQAVEDGALAQKTDVDEVIHMYCYLFNGVTFNWCISGGDFDMVEVTRKVLKAYAENI